MMSVCSADIELAWSVKSSRTGTRTVYVNTGRLSVAEELAWTKPYPLEFAYSRRQSGLLIAVQAVRGAGFAFTGIDRILQARVKATGKIGRTGYSIHRILSEHAFRPLHFQAPRDLSATFLTDYILHTASNTPDLFRTRAQTSSRP